MYKYHFSRFSDDNPFEHFNEVELREKRPDPGKQFRQMPTQCF